MRSRKFVDAKLALKDLISRVRIYQQTSEHLTVEFLALKERFNLPQYRWDYLSAYMDAYKDQWLGPYSRGGCVVCMMTFGEKLVPNDWGMLTDEQREIVKADSAKGESQRFRMGHYWRNDDGTPGRIFF